MTENIPFPQIPRINEEEKLKGSPASVEESLFLTVPELAGTANMLADFNKAKSNQATNILSKISCEFVQDPQKMTEVFDALHLLEEVEGYHSKNLEDKLLERMEKIGASPTITPEVIEKLLEISSGSNLYGRLADNIIKNTIARCADKASVVNFMYNLSLAGLSSGNENVLKRTAEILSFKSDMLDSTSKQGMAFVLANFDPSDEVSLKKTLEIDAVLDWQTNKKFPEILIFKKKTIEELMETKDFKKILPEVIKKDPGKCKKLFAFYDHYSDSGPGISKINGEVIRNNYDFPYNLIMNDPGPLREWQNKRVIFDLSTENGSEKYFNLHVPGHEGVSEIYGDLALSIAEMIKNADKSQGELTKEKYWQTLSMMAPEEIRSDNVLVELNKINEIMREEIKNNSRMLLSPRGDEIEITDDLLKDYGFKSILYEMNPGDKRETVATINVSGLKYKILLDKYLTIREFESRQNMNLPNESVFIKNVILSHLRELRCSEKVFEAGEGETSIKYNETARRAFTSRRAHRRILPAGHNPTKHQIASIMEAYGIDIIRMNKEREPVGEKRKATYVFEVENAAIGGKKPVKSYTPEATSKLKEILKNNNHEKKDKN